jgi:glycine cleavage system H protein
MIKVRKGLRYTQDDVWVQQTGEAYRVGITDLAQRMGGDIVFVDFLSRGEFKKGEPLASYETIKAVLDVKAPFDCSVARVNSRLNDYPELMNTDPYGEGWVVEVKPVAPGQVTGLLSDQEYFKHMKTKAEAEVRKLKGV